MDHKQWKKKGQGEKEKAGKRTMCTSEVAENPADCATGTLAASFLPIIPLFSTSDSDSELSSMARSPLPLSLSAPNYSTVSPPKSQSGGLTFNFDPGTRRQINSHSLLVCVCVCVSDMGRAEPAL